MISLHGGATIEGGPALRRFVMLVGSTLLAASTLLALDAAPVQAGCGWAYTVQEGRGGVTGSVLARHKFQSNYCWTTYSTSDASNTLHTAQEVGWTSFPMSVSTQGNSVSKWGSSYIATGYARAEVCIFGTFGGCSTHNTYIQHTLKPNGMVSKSVPKWSV
jgi:hypothetical protein